MATTTTTRPVPSLKQARKAISEDYLLRDGGTFVYQRGSGRLNWEKDLPSGSAYSEEILSLDRARGRRSDEDIIKGAHGIAQRLLDTLDIKGSVTLKLNPGTHDSCTNGKSLLVSTKVFDDKDLDIAHRLDIFLGTAEHEGLHCEFTDFAVHSPDQILQSLVNIVEDERIEHCAGEKYPGLANYLKPFKYYYFDQYKRRHAAENAKLPYAARLVNAIITLVRYPRCLTDAELTEFGEYLVPVHDVMKDFPTSTAEAMATAKKIYDIIQDAIKREPEKKSGKGSSGSGKSKNSGSEKETDKSSGSEETKEDESEDGSGKSEETTGEPDSEDESKGKNGTGKASGSEEDDEDKDGGEGSEGSEESEDGDGSGEESSEESENGSDGETSGESEGEGDGEGTDNGERLSGGLGSDSDADPVPDGDGEDSERTVDDAETPSWDEEKQYRELTEEEKNEVLNAIRRMLREYAEDTDSSTNTSKTVSGTPEIDSLCRGEAERGEDARTIFLTEKGDDDFAERQYRADLDAVRPFIPAMRNILAAQATRNVYQLKGMKSGRLDGDKLSQAYIGSPCVYRQQKEVKSNKVAVCILVDESGSMCGNKIRSARRTAILLNEALGSLPNVDLFIYGHTADEGGSAEFQIRSYRDHQCHGKYALGRLEGRWDNADGYAILEVARRVRQQTAEKALFFVISDGAPAAHVYRGMNGVLHTRNAVKQVTRQGFIPVQIAIDSYCEPKEMFDHYVTLTDLPSLPRDLAAMVKKAVLENTERR